MSRRITAALSLAILVLFTLVDSARPGGLYISEFGTSVMGTASAGAPAGTDDASTAIHNPAGMTRLDDHHLSLGAAPAAAIVKFDPDSDTPVAGTNGGDQGGFIPIMGSQYVHKLSDRWRLGVGMLSFSGAALDPSDDWVGRIDTSRPFTELERISQVNEKTHAAGRDPAFSQRIREGLPIPRWEVFPLHRT